MLFCPSSRGFSSLFFGCFFSFLSLASGQDSAGGSRNRMGPITQSIVLGTLNVGDPGEAVVPDLSRVSLCCYAYFGN